MWTSSNQLKAFKSKNWVFLAKKKFCLKAAATTPARASSLQACPTDFRFANPHNCVSQFLYIQTGMSVSMYARLSLSLLSCWFCFSGKPWLFSSCFQSWLFGLLLPLQSTRSKAWSIREGNRCVLLPRPLLRGKNDQVRWESGSSSRTMALPDFLMFPEPLQNHPWKGAPATLSPGWLWRFNEITALEHGT